MNALTKAFVVVVTILSVVLVVLVVSFAARVPDYAAKYDQLKQEYEARLTAASDTANKVRNEIAAAGIDMDDARASISSLQDELSKANNDINSLQAQLDQATLALNRSTAGIQISATANQSKSEQINKLNELIQEQLTTIGDLQSQRADVSQALIEERSKTRRLSDNYMRMQEQNKALEQQLLESQAKLKTAMDQLAGLIPGFDGESDLPPSQPTVAIRGSVTKIDQLKDGLTFVQVNVGTRDLVKKGMEFTVYRGDEFVGKIQIASVDTAESVGQLTLGGGVQEGDNVRAGGR